MKPMATELLIPMRGISRSNKGCIGLVQVTGIRNIFGVQLDSDMTRTQIGAGSRVEKG